MSTELGFVKKKYADLIKMGKEAIDAVKIPFEVRKAEKDLEKEIIVLEQKIAEQELKIQDAKGTRPLNLQVILDGVDQRDLLERSLKLAQELKTELF